MLTGNKDTDDLVLLRLDDETLTKLFYTSRYFRKIDEKEDFWFKKIRISFPFIEFENKDNDTWKKQYICLFRSKKIIMEAGAYFGKYFYQYSRDQHYKYSKYEMAIKNHIDKNVGKIVTQVREKSKEKSKGKSKEKNNGSAEWKWIHDDFINLNDIYYILTEQLVDIDWLSLIDQLLTKPKFLLTKEKIILILKQTNNNLKLILKRRNDQNTRRTIFEMIFAGLINFKHIHHITRNMTAEEVLIWLFSATHLYQMDEVATKKIINIIVDKGIHIKSIKEKYEKYSAEYKNNDIKYTKCRLINVMENMMRKKRPNEEDSFF